MRPILLVMWTAFQSFILRHNNDNNNNNSNNIIITFIYTAQIQLYSFQMRLTIKDLKIYLTIKDPKIYRKKKITTLNYSIISEKAFLKR